MTSRVPLAPSLPQASYIAEAEFARKRDAVLFADWFCAGRSESLAEAGDYLTADVAGESIVVARTASGTLTGWYNLCRHRGSRLVPPAAGQPSADPARTGCFAGAVRCPYHAWTYGLGGELRAAPFLPSLRRYRAELGLHRVDVAGWGGFLFVRLDPRGDDDPLAATRSARYRAGWPATRWPNCAPRSGCATTWPPTGR